ncbi:10051_t:CDS:2, partial [Dentiscutata heterogama]
DDLTISGPKTIVEIDESKFQKLENFWIIGAIERTKEKKCFFVISENQSLGMKYKRENHSKVNIKNRKMNIHSNTIEGIWSGLKMQISEHNRNKHVIEDYLLEYCWCNEHCNNLFNAFLEALQQAKN